MIDMERVRTDLERLLKLPRGWDSYGARTIRQECADKAIAVLEDLADLNLPQPTVVPMSCGGIQLEWHSEMDFEIECRPNSEPEFYLFDEDTEREGSVTRDREWLKQHVEMMRLTP